MDGDRRDACPTPVAARGELGADPPSRVAQHPAVSKLARTLLDQNAFGLDLTREIYLAWGMKPVGQRSCGSRSTDPLCDSF